MLKKIAFAGAGILLLASPLLASAQGADVVSECSSFARNMGLNDTDATTGGDVTRLQQFFYSQYEGFPSPTGFFGSITENAVEQWQTEHDIVSSGTPDTTGYGRVGPATRASINASNNQSCSGSQGTDTTTTVQSTITIPAQDENAFVFFATPGTSGEGNVSIEYKLCEGFDLSWGDGKTSSAAGVGSDCSIIKKVSLKHTYSSGVATYYPSLTRGLAAPASRVMRVGSAPLVASCSLLTTGAVDDDGAFDMTWSTSNATDVRLEGVPLTGESGTATLYNTGLTNRHIGLSMVGIDGGAKTCGFGPFNEAEKLPAGVSVTTHTSPVKRTSSSSATNGFETAEAFRGQTNTQHAVNCVAGQIYTFRVRGTDVYTDNSLVCGAAVHAGLIQFSTGGSVMIRIVPSPSSFTGSTRNGVTSSSISGWYGSGFEFVTNQPSPQFAVGDRVQTTFNANVRSAASISGGIVGTQVSGSFGAITGGPTVASGYAWWHVNFDSGADGWTVQSNLRAATSPQQCPAGTTGTYPNCTNTDVTATTSALPINTHDQVQLLYVGYLGRAADAAGMTYYSGLLNSNAKTLAQVAQEIGMSAEAKAKYSYLASPNASGVNAFLDIVYQALFNRAPDSVGRTHWTNELTARTGDAARIAQIILDIASGAQGSDIITMNAKITAANAVTPDTDPPATPSAPSNLTAVCNGGTSATLSWTRGAGAVYSFPRASSTAQTSQSMCPSGYSWASPTTCYQDNVTATSVTYPVQAGVTYRWWVHNSAALPTSGWTNVSAATIGGTSFTCQANTINVVNGACGSANGTTVASAPSSNLCTAGTAGTVSGSGPWTWSCAGTGGGTNASCSASKTATTPTTSCTAPWGATVANGSSVTAYSTSFVAVGSTCVSEPRTCTNGSLSGGYYYQNCSPGTVSASVGTDYGAVTFSSPPAGATYVKGSDTIPVRFSQGFGAVQFENVATGVISSGAGLFSGTDNQMNIPFDLTPGNYRLVMHNERYDGTSNTFTVAATGNSPLWVKPGSELNACRFFAGVDKYDVVTTRDARCTGARCVSPKFIIMWSASSGMYEDRPDYLPADGTLKQIRCSATGAEPAATAAAASCPFAGGTLAHGASVDAYQAASVPLGSSCVTERRTCLNGSLSGSYQFSSCEPAWSAGQSIWVKPGHEAAVCTIAAGASAYTNVTTRNASCTGARCVSPKFFWAIGGTLIAEDRPDYLPADGIVKQIQCTATTAAAGTNTQMLSQLANALNAIIAILNSLK